MIKLMDYAIIMSVFFNWTVVCYCADNSEEVKKAIGYRLASLQNIIADYNVNTTHTPRQKDIERVNRKNAENEARGSETQIVLVNGSDKFQMNFSFLHGKSKYEKTFLEIKYDTADNLLFPKLEVYAYPESGAEFLQQNGYGGYIGSITERAELPSEGIDIGLGMRAWGQNNWINEQLLKVMSVSMPDRKTAILEHVDSKDVKHKWVVDLELGCAVKRYERILTRYNNKLNHVMTMEDFKKTEGLMLPHKMTLLALDSEGGNSRISVKMEIEVIEYKLNNPQNTPERYHINWPKGAIINDTILKAVYISDGTGLVPQRYAGRNDILEPIQTKPVNGKNEVTMENSVHRELFIPNAQLALKKNEAFILDLAHLELISIPSKSNIYSEKFHEHLINLGKGDLVWDGTIVTVRKAKALTISKESHRPLKCTPGRWCNWDRLPVEVDLPYSFLAVSKEDTDHLVTILKIENEGIRIICQKMTADEAKLYYPTEENSM